MQSAKWKLSGVSQAALACVATTISGTAWAQVPAVEAKFTPRTLNLSANGVASVELPATNGSLAGCTASNVMIGTAAAVSVLPSGDAIVATFNRSDLAALPA